MNDEPGALFSKAPETSRPARKAIFSLSVYTAKKGLLGFGISITSKNVFKPKKVNSDAFCHEIKL